MLTVSPVDQKESSTGSIVRRLYIPLCSTLTKEESYFFPFGIETYCTCSCPMLTDNHTYSTQYLHHYLCTWIVSCYISTYLASLAVVALGSRERCLSINPCPWDRSFDGQKFSRRLSCAKSQTPLRGAQSADEAAKNP